MEKLGGAHISKALTQASCTQPERKKARAENSIMAVSGDFLGEINMALLYVLTLFRVMIFKNS